MSGKVPSFSVSLNKTDGICKNELAGSVGSGFSILKSLTHELFRQNRGPLRKYVAHYARGHLFGTKPFLHVFVQVYGHNLFQFTGISIGLNIGVP